MLLKLVAKMFCYSMAIGGENLILGQLQDIVGELKCEVGAL